MLATDEKVFFCVSFSNSVISTCRTNPCNYSQATVHIYYHTSNQPICKFCYLTVLHRLSCEPSWLQTTVWGPAMYWITYLIFLLIPLLKANPRGTELTDIQESQHLSISQTCVYCTHSWQITWKGSLGSRSLLTAWFRCKVSVGWGAVCLQTYNMPGLTCPSVNSTCWRLLSLQPSLSLPKCCLHILGISTVRITFYHKPIFLIVVLIILRHEKNKIFFVSIYIYVWLKHLQALTDRCIFK